MVLPHGSYLFNPASSEVDKWEKTKDGMLDECLRCERLGIRLYNFHPGSTLGKCSIDEAVANVARMINYIHERTKFIVLGSRRTSSPLSSGSNRNFSSRGNGRLGECNWEKLLRAGTHH